MPFDQNTLSSETGCIALNGYGLQKTLLRPISCNGIGVHSGQPANLKLLPAPENTGIVFRRVDLSPSVEIKALWHRVTDTKLCTVLTSENGHTSVGTVEHLMAALAGCQIDNAVIEIDGPEVPIMDGSAEPFVFLIGCAGTLRQNAIRKAIRILKPVEVIDGNKHASFAPAAQFSLDLEIDFAGSPVGRQTRFTVFDEDSFRDELARARTFGFMQEVEMLKKNGLARGGSLDNAIVIDGQKILNKGGLRYKDEFVRHKTLDAIGDLYLAGCPLIGRFTGSRSGHAMNNRLLRAVLADASAYDVIDMPNPEVALGMGGSVFRPRQIAASAII
jgi:UDP-3-O-[3-hydroxymyristoyl] N-acetylglucosamine deacetylase